MADFKLYWPLLLKQEGYYANDTDDTGGETWEGIARNKYPGWSGWPIIDSYKTDGKFKCRNQANILLKPDLGLQVRVIAFYKSSQWDVLEADQINNQSVANFIVDWGVNGGLSTPVKHVQKVLGLTIDGKMGPHTLSAINSSDGLTLFNKLKQERIDFYHAVVAANPVDKKYLTTWLDRTNSFSYAA